MKITQILNAPRPQSLTAGMVWPDRAVGFPSPSDWRDEVIYFLLPDRFSDGRDRARPVLDRNNLWGARPSGWRWDRWAQSGCMRYQGGTLAGVTSRLDYLVDLGVSTIWLGPCFKQRAERNDYHGYAIQDFLDVDPRFGTRGDLVDLVSAAHDSGIRVILDIVINHTGENWLYACQLAQLGAASPPYRDLTQGPYDFGAWLDGYGRPLSLGAAPQGPDDGVWPVQLQDPQAYHRAGFGDYSRPGTDSCSASAEFRRADWYNRDLALSDGPLGGQVLQALIDIWRYWMALTDCDGFRIDTFKHFRVDEGRRFCAAMREYAGELGKDNFLLVAEIGGGDTVAERYLDRIGRNLSAVLEVGELRGKLRDVAAETGRLVDLLGAFELGKPAPPSTCSECPDTTVGTHRALGDVIVYSIDDHDNLNLWPAPKLRFASEHRRQVVVAVALLLFTIGIPSLYYGTEQELAGPEDEERQWLPEWGGSNGDRYLREAMFGPDHPRRAGRAGLPEQPCSFDDDLPGFGAFGTTGHHVFDTANPTFLRVRHLLATRRQQRVLRRGRQYARQIRVGDGPFVYAETGGLIAWSRILGSCEDLCVANCDPVQSRDADVIVDAGLNGASGGWLEVVADTVGVDPCMPPSAQPLGSQIEVGRAPDGTVYVPIRGLGPGEVRVLSNRAG